MGEQPLYCFLTYKRFLYSLESAILEICCATEVFHAPIKSVRGAVPPGINPIAILSVLLGGDMGMNTEEPVEAYGYGMEHEPHHAGSRIKVIGKAHVFC